MVLNQDLLIPLIKENIEPQVRAEDATAQNANIEPFEVAGADALTIVHATWKSSPGEHSLLLGLNTHIGISQCLSRRKATQPPPSPFDNSMSFTNHPLGSISPQRSPPQQ